MNSETKIRTYFARSARAERPKVHCTDSHTEQYHAVEHDINNIVDRALRTGAIDPSLVRTIGRFVDVADYGDFQSAQNRIADASNAFAGLPGRIRERFNNSPQMLLEFLADERNRPEAERLGLVEKRAAASSPVGTGSLDKTVPTDTTSEASGVTHEKA